MIKITIILLFLTVATHAAKFPSNWKKCPKTNNEECLKEAVNFALKDLKNGKKELNVIPIDPLRFNQMDLSQGGASPVKINLTYYDVDLIGPSRLNFTSIKADWDKLVFEFDARVVDGPAMLIGDYSIDGNVLVLPIRGKGKSNITLDNFSVLMTLYGSEETRNNKKYLKVDKCDFIIRSTRVHLYFGNLFEGVPNLGDSMNNFLNENWKEIMSELNATISSAVGLGVKEVANNLFQKIPLTQLYSSN